MRLQREVSLGILALLSLQLLPSLLAISLLTRMGPAIEQILQENVASTEAAKEMTIALAELHHINPQGTPPEAFEAALARANENVTEDAERPLLSVVEARRGAAFSGDPAARAEVISSLRKLGQVNRDSMREADEKAQRLALSGAWAAAVLGALPLGLGIFLYRRLRLRLEIPIEEVRLTTQRIREGNLQARCPTTDGPIEVKQLANDLNWILDHWLHKAPKPNEATQNKREDELRPLVNWLLDQQRGPAIILDKSGARVASNQEAVGVALPPELTDWETLEIPNSTLRILRPIVALDKTPEPLHKS